METQYTIPTEEQVSEIKKRAERTDWTPLYEALAGHGKIIVPKLTDNMKNAIYNRYRHTRKKVCMTSIPGGTSYLIELTDRELV